MTSEQITKAVILVGGPSRGTRFRPLSFKTPKPLFPVAGRPMIYHHIKALSQLGIIKEVLIIGFYEPELFNSFIDSAQNEFGIGIRYLREYQSLGTAGGLYHFRDQILRGSTERFFVMNADVVCSFPLQEMLDSHIRNYEKPKCTILATTVEDSDSAHRFGCLVKNEKNQVMHYVEKPESFLSNLISCGVFLFENTIFQQMKNIKAMKEEKEEAFGLEIDVLRPMAGTGQLYVYEMEHFWNQIKTPGSSVSANRMYLQSYMITCPDLVTKHVESGAEIISPVYIHPSASIHGTAKIGPNVSIGANAVVGRGVRVAESIILENVTLKENSCILNSIVGMDTNVGEWARVEGTPEPAPNRPLTTNGIKVPSITILGGDISVEPEVIIRNCIVLPHKELRNSYHNEILL
ncbi:Nucleotidyl transferase domain-containing protein [Rozella allomycis CSF55]|uniref:mannose-1-phosphate guanylyltransferase n=1 Tax=Rozella allomycis (strain CSF55) TaxID=988480 RepID=A0A075B487_ROZAC|nr:Nucleotidyl transferase domain-containing protein [Rozella allomycis CSF55]|eukprot:EPZ36100.1 Nucleotidyl transferase domain-containing protein [Rozella allomycis CSF55]